MSDTADTANTPRPMPPLTRYRVRFREHIPPGGVSIASPRAGYLGSAWPGSEPALNAGDHGWVPCD